MSYMFRLYHFSLKCIIKHFYLPSYGPLNVGGLWCQCLLTSVEFWLKHCWVHFRWLRTSEGIILHLRGLFTNQVNSFIHEFIHAEYLLFRIYDWFTIWPIVFLEINARLWVFYFTLVWCDQSIGPLCRVGGATSQLDLPSLTPLSIAGCGWLQLGAPHWATSVNYCK